MYCRTAKCVPDLNGIRNVLSGSPLEMVNLFEKCQLYPRSKQGILSRTSVCVQVVKLKRCWKSSSLGRVLLSILLPVKRASDDLWVRGDSHGHRACRSERPQELINAPTKAHYVTLDYFALIKPLIVDLLKTLHQIGWSFVFNRQH